MKIMLWAVLVSAVGALIVLGVTGCLSTENLQLNPSRNAAPTAIDSAHVADSILLGVAHIAPPIAEETVDVAPPIEGFVDFRDGLRQTMVTVAEVASGSTVSLIDPPTGNTVASTLTLANPAGKFRLTFSKGFAPSQGPYFIEAVKGLARGGQVNRAGATVARLRTLISFEGGWKSLSSGGSIILNRATTALASLSNLKALSQIQNLDLIGKLQIGTSATVEGITSPDSFVGTPAISVVEFHRTFDMVAQSLKQDVDPIGAIFMRPMGATSSVVVGSAPGYGMREGIAWSADGMKLSRLDPTNAGVGATVIIRGIGLPSATSSVTVFLGALNCPVEAASALGEAITIRIPAGATSGNLEVRYGLWTDSSLFLTVI